MVLAIKPESQIDPKEVVEGKNFSGLYPHTITNSPHIHRDTCKCTIQMYSCAHTQSLHVYMHTYRLNSF